MTGQELFLSWLNDAYAMENAIIQTLENHVKVTQDRPDLHERFQSHLDETRRHRELIKSRIEALGGDTSTLKNAMSSLMGTMQGVGTSAAEDELVKDVIGDFATEHVEIAAYTSLIAAAREIGDDETARVCTTILHDEESMADWLKQQLPLVTREVMHQQAAAH